MLHIDLTTGFSENDGSYTASAVRTSLTKNVAIKFADVQDEIATAFEHYIPAKPDGDFVPNLTCIYLNQHTHRMAKDHSVPYNNGYCRQGH